MNKLGSQLPHRASRSFRMQWLALIRDLIVTLLITGFLWLYLNHIAEFWTLELSFWMYQTGLTGYANTSVSNAVGGISFIPAFDVVVPTTLPTTGRWWLTALLCMILWLWSMRLAPNRLPLIYFMRLVILVQISSLVFFYMWPESLPTTIANFLIDVLRQSISLMLLVPALYAATLYLFVLPWWIKYLATLTALFYLTIFVPLQASCIAWILQVGGILFMPTLYLFFGLLPQIVALMGIYSFALSLLPADETLFKRGIIR